MNHDIKDYLSKKHINFKEETVLNKILPEVDIVYMTRTQKERMRQEDLEKASEKYIISLDNLELIKPKSRLLHPLPHVGEIQIPIDIKESDP